MAVQRSIWPAENAAAFGALAAAVDLSMEAPPQGAVQHLLQPTPVTRRRASAGCPAPAPATEVGGRRGGEE
jgi:hypothetical protein